MSNDNSTNDMIDIERMLAGVSPATRTIFSELIANCIALASIIESAPMSIPAQSSLNDGEEKLESIEAEESSDAGGSN